jgi:hypothetical protein
LINIFELTTKIYSAVRFQACIMIIEKVGVSFHNDSLEK